MRDIQLYFSFSDLNVVIALYCYNGCNVQGFLFKITALSALFFPIASTLNFPNPSAQPEMKKWLHAKIVMLI